MEDLSVMTDEALAMSYANGNNRAFDELLSRNQSKLFSYILLYTPRKRYYKCFLYPYSYTCPSCR